MRTLVSAVNVMSCMLWCAAAECSADVRIDKALSVSLSYWLQLSLHDVDDLFIGHHWELINAIVPVYDRFVHHGTCLNRTLKEEYEVLYDLFWFTLRSEVCGGVFWYILSELLYSLTSWNIHYV